MVQISRCHPRRLSVGAVSHLEGEYSNSHVDSSSYEQRMWSLWIVNCALKMLTIRDEPREIRVKFPCRVKVRCLDKKPGYGMYISICSPRYCVRRECAACM